MQRARRWRSPANPRPTSGRPPGVATGLRAVALVMVAAAATGCASAGPATTVPAAPSEAAGSAATTSTARPPPAAPSPDRLAGLLDRSVPPAGPGTFDVVRGSSPAPARSRTLAVRVEVERGLRVDGTAFAAFVLATLNDPRSWGRDGNVGFARTDGPAPIQVRLATPATTDRLCGELGTGGRLSCRTGERAVLNHFRWVAGTPDYGTDLTAYRRYLVNHEVGHVLGHGHVTCPGRGALAPLMQQQTLGLDGCRPNPWPYP